MIVALVLLVNLAVAVDVTQALPAQNSSTTNRLATLDTCLRDAGVPTAAAGSESPFNRRLPFAPAAVAVPTSIEHIQAAVVCGAQAGLKVSAKSGGHSYSSLGLGGEDGHLVLELERMNAVTVDRARGNMATVQPGARLGHVATQLYSQGRRAISHGTCPGVGIGGHVLHGGFGMASHTHGLALDALVGGLVVLADGSIAETSETLNEGLLWALKGAGSNFGIVAEFRFDTFAAPDAVTYFTVRLDGWSSENAMRTGLAALRDYAMDTMPPELNMRLAGTPSGASLEGVYFGSQPGLQSALAPLLRSAAGGSISQAHTVGWLEGLRAWANGEKLDESYPYSQVGLTRFPTSHPPAIPPLTRP